MKWHKKRFVQHCNRLNSNRYLPCKLPCIASICLNLFQAVSQFSSALESGQLGPVVSQLAVNPEAVAAATQGNMQEFVKALEKNSGESSSSDGKKKEESETKSKDKKGDKDDDEDMQID